MKKKVAILTMLAFLMLGCNLIDIVPAGEKLKTEIPAENDTASAPAPEQQVVENIVAATSEPTATPQPTPTAAPTATPFFLRSLSMTSPECGTDNECNREPPRHGLIIAVLLPILGIGIPWVIAEFFVVRYIQPRSIDLSEVLIKAQDGIFIQAAISMTARRSLTLASTRMTWPRVRDFVEKTLEQELIHEALNFPTLDDLERNLKDIAERFKDLPIVRELLDDFGVEVMRFNIESRYPQETMDALNRKAEAAAGGTAYLAYAAAAHLDPDSRESRELYRVYQETRGQVDAARNLGGGLSNLAGLMSERGRREVRPDDADN